MNKNIKITIASLSILSTSIFTSCGDKHDDEELITNVKITATEQGTSNVVVAEFADPDGDGGNGPTRFDSIKLKANKTYNAKIDFINASVTPAESITGEIESEGTDHEIFYQPTNTGVTVNNLSKDSKGLPLGTTFDIVTGTTAVNGRMQVILKHKPGTKAAGDVSSKGETDIELPNGGFYYDISL